MHNWVTIPALMALGAIVLAAFALFSPGPSPTSAANQASPAGEGIRAAAGAALTGGDAAQFTG